MAKPSNQSFNEFPVLTSRRLLLRKIVASDAGSIIDLCFYDGVAASSELQAERFLQQIEQDYRRGESLHWGICRKGDQAIVGTCGFYRGFANHTGEVGYVLREKDRGRGIMTEALALIVSFGFRELNLDRIVAHTSQENAPSIAVLGRVGFVPAQLETRLPPSQAAGGVTYALHRTPSPGFAVTDCDPVTRD